MWLITNCKKTSAEIYDVCDGRVDMRQVVNEQGCHYSYMSTSHHHTSLVASFHCNHVQNNKKKGLAVVGLEKDSPYHSLYSKATATDYVKGHKLSFSKEITIFNG